MKNLLSAIARHGPWPLWTLVRYRPESSALALPASSIAGLLVGAISALTFLLGSLLLPARVAILLSLCVGLAASVPRTAFTAWALPIKAKSGLVIGLMLLLKLEMLSEVDIEWVPVTLICSAAWSRAAALAARPDPITGMAQATGVTRLATLLIGMLPLAFFGFWPEPVWGLWVAGLVSLVFARLIKPRGWAAPITARWIALEAIYCLCVLLLMSAATLTGIANEEPPES